MNLPGNSASAVNPSRIPALQSLRAMLMFLGIIAHVILVMPFFEPALATSDQNYLQGIYNFIHVFRLPTYFLISGYLAAWLLQRSGPRGFLISRFKRITSVLVVDARGVLCGALNSNDLMRAKVI